MGGDPLPETLCGPMPHDRCMESGCIGHVRFAYHGWGRYNECVSAISTCNVCGEEEGEYIACAAPGCDCDGLKHDGSGLRRIGRTDDEIGILWLGDALGTWARPTGKEGRDG